MKKYYKFPLVAVLSLTTACGLFASSNPSDDEVVLPNSQAEQMNDHNEESIDSTRNVLTADDYTRMREIIQTNARPMEAISQIFDHLQGKDILSIKTAPSNLLIDIYNLFHELSCEDKKLSASRRAIFLTYASHILSTEGPEGFVNAKSLLTTAFEVDPESLLQSVRDIYVGLRQEVAQKYLNHPEAKNDLKEPSA